MKVGDTVKHRMRIWDPEHKAGEKPAETTVNATVVYIHPEGRFYTLRFDLGPGRSFRESFHFTH